MVSAVCRIAAGIDRTSNPNYGFNLGEGANRHVTTTSPHPRGANKSLVGAD